MSVSKNLVSKTYVSSVTSLLDAISDPQRYGGQYMQRLVGSVVPSGVGAVARAVDPVIREVETPLDAIQARIPGASQSLPPKIGAFDEAAQRSGNVVSRLISPVVVSDENQNNKRRAQSKLNALSATRKARKDREKRLQDIKRARIKE